MLKRQQSDVNEQGWVVQTGCRVAALPEKSKAKDSAKR